MSSTVLAMIMTETQVIHGIGDDDDRDQVLHIGRHNFDIKVPRPSKLTMQSLPWHAFTHAGREYLTKHGRQQQERDSRGTSTV